MSESFQFLVPAGQIDFPQDRALQASLAELWDSNLNCFTQQGMAGNPWNATNASPITNYFNPKNTAVPEGTPTVAIEWTVFPNRINYYCAALGQPNIYSLADRGVMTDGRTSFPQITNPCTGVSVLFGPYGPRGWQDEYCEWSIAYDANGNITRIDFTCESPEYWNSLWMISPAKVLELYQQTLGKPQILLAELCLYDPNGDIVIDPSTNRPVYNPLNKWNNGTYSDAQQGGAMHLTSTPNTLQTDIGLANASTIQRTIGNTDPEKLICCAQYGQPMRNSDPHIGQSVNQDVQGELTVSLCNPPGLFMQLPDFSLFTFPEGTTYNDFYTIVRGVETLNDQYGQPLPGNFILHAVFQAPTGHSISDVTINKNGTWVPITWAAQIAETINNQIVAYGLSAPAPVAMGCVGSPASSATFNAPLQLFHASVFGGMLATPVANPVNQPMSLLSNSTMIPPMAALGQTYTMVLTCATDITDPLPTVTFDGNDITVSVDDITTIEYAVPGNSYPGSCSALTLSVTVSANAVLGLRNLYATNAGQAQSAAMPALLNVVSSI